MRPPGHWLPPDPGDVRRGHLCAEREVESESVQRDSRRSFDKLGVVAAAEPRCQLHHARAGEAEPDLRVRRPVADAERRRSASPRRRLRRCRRARPDVCKRDTMRWRLGGQPVCDRQRHEHAVDGDCVDRDFRSFDELLDQVAATPRSLRSSCDSARELPTLMHDRQPALTLLIDRLDTHGSDGSSPGEPPCGWGTPASEKRSLCRALDVASPAVAPSIGCGRPIRSAIRAATPTAQSAPGEITPSTLRARASRSSADSSSVEITARSSAYSNPIACGSRSAAMTWSPRARAASSRPSCAGPAPRTRRRGRRAGGCLATRPRSRDTRRPYARARPRSWCRHASR